jgi:hypothetical protein
LKAGIGQGHGGRRPRLSGAASLIASGSFLFLGLAACGSSQPILDTGLVERAAAASILAEHHLRVTVHCPAGVPKRAGFTFFCTAHLEVGSYPLFVTETNAAGRVRYENRTPLEILDIASVEHAIERSIREQRRVTASVSCPQEVIQRSGVAFVCRAEIAGHSHEVEVLETNDAGHVRYRGLR